MQPLDPDTNHALAQKIFDNIGGAENLATGETKLTRLKLTLLDPKKVNETSLLLGEDENLIGVLERVETENAVYIVLNKLDLAKDLWNEISRIKTQALTEAPSKPLT